MGPPTVSKTFATLGFLNNSIRSVQFFGIFFKTLSKAVPALFFKVSAKRRLFSATVCAGVAIHLFHCDPKNPLTGWRTFLLRRDTPRLNVCPGFVIALRTLRPVRNPLLTALPTGLRKNATLSFLYHLCFVTHRIKRFAIERNIFDGMLNPPFFAFSPVSAISSVPAASRIPLFASAADCARSASFCCSSNNSSFTFIVSSVTSRYVRYSLPKLLCSFIKETNFLFISCCSSVSC